MTEKDEFGNVHMPCGSRIYASAEIVVDTFGDKSVRKTGKYFLSVFVGSNDKNQPIREVHTDNSGLVYYKSIPDAIAALKRLFQAGVYPKPA